MEKEVKQLIYKHPSLEIAHDGNKVKCSLSEHEMPCKAEAIRTYVAGKKYKRALERHNCTLLEKYQQHLEPSFKKMRKNQLFCRLTWRHLNNEASHIAKHINGKRFQKALKRLAECIETGETYKPITSLYGMKRERENDIEGKTLSTNADDSGSDVGRDESVDDMEDLYPAEDLDGDSQSDTGDSDFEFEDLEATATQPEVDPGPDPGPDPGEVTSSSAQNGVKRKQKEQSDRHAKRRRFMKKKLERQIRQNRPFRKRQNQHKKNENIQQPGKNRDQSKNVKNKTMKKGNG